VAEFVDKQRLAVRVCMAWGEPLDGTLMLAPQAQFHDGPETLLERLNTPDRVVPFQLPEGGGTLLLMRDAIEWVLAGNEVDPSLVAPPRYRVTREEQVRLSFLAGGELSGLLQMELPEMFSRASDFLNGAEDFFPLLAATGVVMVNKRQVVQTHVLSSAPVTVSFDPSRDLIG